MIWITFEGARNAIKSEALLKESGIGVRVIPAPATISSNCGIVLAVEEEQRSLAEEILTTKEINYKIYEQ